MENIPPMQEVMLEFRAGKMHMTGTRVVPDARRGLVRIGRGEEGLIHFQWLDRTQGVVEDDQIIFPDEACFEKVNQSSDRVFILKFNSDTRKYFFWMQEMQSDNDMDLCNSVNFYINHPLVLVDEEEAEATITLPISERTEDTAEDDISSRAGALVDQVHSSEISSEATSSGPVQLSDLQRILRNIHPIDTVGEEDRGLGLVDLLKPDLVLPLIRTLPLEQGLISYLPEGTWTPEDVMELFQSPPFRQQMETFTHVLRTGQVDLSQFGIDPSKYKLSVVSFLEALDDSVAKASGSDQIESTNEGIDPNSQRSSGGDAMDES